MCGYGEFPAEFGEEFLDVYKIKKEPGERICTAGHYVCGKVFDRMWGISQSIQIYRYDTLGLEYDFNVPIPYKITLDRHNTAETHTLILRLTEGQTSHEEFKVMKREYEEMLHAWNVWYSWAAKKNVQEAEPINAHSVLCKIREKCIADAERQSSCHTNNADTKVPCVDIAAGPADADIADAVIDHTGPIVVNTKGIDIKDIFMRGRHNTMTFLIAPQLTEPPSNEFDLD